MPPDLRGVKKLTPKEYRERHEALSDKAEARSRAAMKAARTRRRNALGTSEKPYKTVITLPSLLWDRARKEIDSNFSRAVRTALVEALERRSFESGDRQDLEAQLAEITTRLAKLEKHQG